MRICVIAAREQRDRQRFVSRPLLMGGHEVNVLLTRPLGSYLVGLWRALKEMPDAIICMGAGPKELIALAGARLRGGPPFVVRLGGDRLKDLDAVADSALARRHYPAWLRGVVEKWIAAFLLRRVHWAIVVNEALHGRVESQLAAGHCAFVVPQFCEGDVVERVSYKCRDPIRLLTVGNFRFSEKAFGVIWLIRQIREFATESRIRVQFVVVGGGQHLNDVVEYVKGMRESEYFNVEVAGYSKDVDRYYRDADVLVYRSYHDATPNVMLESKRHSLPLLANSSEEFRAIVVHGVSGLLYRNECEFKTMLSELIADEGLRRELGRAAGREHATKFSVRAASERLSRTVSEIVASKRG